MIVELVIESATVQSVAQMLPLQVNAETDFPEETRLTYRFLDLRRDKLHQNIVLRSKVIHSILTRFGSNMD